MVKFIDSRSKIKVNYLFFVRKLLISFGTLFVFAIAGRIYLDQISFDWANVDFPNWFRKYGSKYEAGEACSEWELKKNEGVRYNVYSGDGSPSVYCRWENGQYLGIDNETKKVRKRFKY